MMSDETTTQGQRDEEPIDWGAIFRRKDRPLPKRGCSWAFYIFMLLLLLFLAFMFMRYKNA